jgi:hypothetical protein
MRHRHPYSEPDCVEIDEHVCLRRTVHGGNPDITESKTGEIAGGPDEHLYGFIVAYDWPDSDVRLEGAVCVDPHGSPKAVWQMTGSLEGGDLTLSPSIQAYDSRVKDTRSAPTIHGYVRGGKWVPA